MQDSIKDLKANTENSAHKENNCPQAIKARMEERNPAPKVKKKSNEKNGVKMPVRKNTDGYKVWQLATHLSNELQAVPTVDQMLEAVGNYGLGIKEVTLKRNFSQWRKYWGADEAETPTKAAPEEETSEPEPVAPSIPTPPEKPVVENPVVGVALSDSDEKGKVTVALNGSFVMPTEEPVIEDTDKPGWMQNLSEQEETPLASASETVDTDTTPELDLPAFSIPEPKAVVQENKPDVSFDTVALDSALKMDAHNNLAQKVHGLLAKGGLLIYTHQALGEASQVIMDLIAQHPKEVRDYLDAQDSK